MKVVNKLNNMLEMPKEIYTNEPKIVIIGFNELIIVDNGFKSVSGSYRGDLIFTVSVQIPKRLTAEQRELLEKLAKTMNEQPPVKKRGIFG